MITSFATAIGGMLNTLPFVISDLIKALHLACLIVIVELVGISMMLYRFMKSPFWSTSLQVIVGGEIVFLLGIWLAKVGI